jgi:hypothetical protein
MLGDIDETRPDYDAEIDICGETFLVRRSHDLLRRLESRFGPLLHLAGRVERLGVTQSELALIYEEISKGDPERPGRLDIERWIWDEGTPKLCPPLRKLLWELPLGNRTLRQLEEEKRIMAADQRERSAAGRPTDPLDQAAVAGLAGQMEALGEAIRNIQNAA